MDCGLQGGPGVDPDAALDEGLERTESLCSYREGEGQLDAEDGPTESTAPRRGTGSLQRSAYGSASGEGRGLLMLHEVMLPPTCVWLL